MAGDYAMSVTKIEVQEAQTQLSELISLAKAGNEIILAQNNMPVARIVPVGDSGTAERIPNLHPGAIVASDDFDQPLPDEFWMGASK